MIKEQIKNRVNGKINSQEERFSGFSGFGRFRRAQFTFIAHANSSTSGRCDPLNL
jgi:hypothetical protein